MSDSPNLLELPAPIAESDHIPSPPAVAMEVVRITQDEEATLDDLAQVLSRDPVLAGKLLKLANSSLFNLGQEVTTLQRATMVLGMKTVKLMSLSFSLADGLPTSGRAQNFDYEAFWQRSLVCAVAGRALAEFTGNQLGDEAFMCGLLSRIGQMVLAHCLPEEYDEVLEQAGERWPTHDLEQRMLGFHGDHVALALLRSWQLPELIVDTIGHMHQPDDQASASDPNSRDLAGIMSLAALVEDLFCDPEKGKSLEELLRLAYAKHHINEDALNGFLLGLEEGIRETADLLNLPNARTTSHEEILNQARLQIVNISIGTAADLTSANRRLEDVEQKAREFESKALTDQLTGLPNRAAFDEQFENELKARMEGQVPRALGVVMLDIDKFKVFNDSHGHQAGDAVLQRVGEVLRATVRKGDLAARYGGEEFVLLLPRTTPFGLKSVAERVRKALENEVTEFQGSKLNVTASLGGACTVRVDSLATGKALVKVADHYLYKAKKRGRNRSEIYGRIQLPKL
jgi:diguanylate cyclase (GGDEF)-like protein